MELLIYVTDLMAWIGRGRLRGREYNVAVVSFAEAVWATYTPLKRAKTLIEPCSNGNWVEESDNCDLSTVSQIPK